MTVPTINRWDWLFASMTLATLVSVVHWMLLYPWRRASSDTSLSHRILTSPWLIHPLRLAYAVGLPAAALLWQGTLTTRGLGLQPLPEIVVAHNAAATGTAEVEGNLAWNDWARDVGWFAAVAASTALIVVLGDVGARRWSTRSSLDTHHNVGVALREAVYHQVHWAFYREPFVMLWGFGLGSWLGALPVLVETVLNPMVWQGIQTHGARYGRCLLGRVGLFAAGTLLFLLTQNLWLLILMDGLVSAFVLSPYPSPGVQRRPDLAQS